MKPTSHKEVSEFLARNVSREVVEGLNILSGMKFPIHDKRSFEAGLEEGAKENKHKERLMQTFNAQDFPILSTENAFEKYFVKFQFPFPFPPLPFQPPIDLPDFSFRPSACDVYYRTFSGPAAECACKAYGEAIREGFNSWQATIIGHFAGRRAERTGRCEV